MLNWIAGFIPVACISLLYVFQPQSVISNFLPKREIPQRLFVIFDGVPFSMVQKLYTMGRFQEYAKPSKVISAFPSTTAACFTGLFRPLGAAKGPGYDAKYFSYPEKRVKGNLLEAYNIGGAGYKRFFKDMRSTGFEQVVMYTAPFFAMRVDLERIKPAVWNNPDEKNIFFYIGSTDGAGHLDGEKEMEALFLEVVDRVEKLRGEYRRDFGSELKTVFLSDHGFYWDEMKPMDVGDLGRTLEKEGVALAEVLDAENKAAVITWGNISGGDFYTDPKNIPVLAKVLLETEGTDLLFYLSGEKIIIEGRRGSPVRAEIVFDEKGERFSYRTVTGDPLEYVSVFGSLGAAGKLTPEGFAQEEDLLAATTEHRYPDALYRVWDAFFGLARNPATLLLSTYEDYEFGDNRTRFGAFLRGGLQGTHGALAEHSSSAFIMTDDTFLKLPEVLRYDQVLKYF